MREEEKKRSSQNSSFKRFFKKRWAFPAIYIASAAIILSAVLWYQNSNSAKNQDDFDYNATDVPGKNINEPAVEVNRQMENFIMPVKEADSPVIQRHFYDMNGKAEEQEAALVFYNNSYHQNTGVDIGIESGETFDVIAALSGTVTKVAEDVLLGNVIEIEHDNGIVTQYQSVTEMNVEVGDQVKQGQVLAKAGESMFDEESGVHVHFEIRKDGVPVNPHNYFQKPLSSLQEDASSDKAKATDEEKAEEDKASDESSTEDGKSLEDDQSLEDDKSLEEDKSSEENAGDEEKDAGEKDKTEDDTKQDKKESADA
ncbi:peptidoglycan DD-metalloendopeptidase family protein [Cytobacillus praedii]|uniref:M23 family peptidase n=1 Tax=Cytobacillus praedii TaxID=1742358 RepID=A0A4R1B3W1_9BACI|nr:M23 family metallopeptidase [Cytobacillus praedii]MED3571269.1 peptidoglycan DD-metalloendopeptidase family protein [Cytobacillus praedii]TCJ05311.1 M23 family peptidase [Cytobacillus praedii]